MSANQLLASFKQLQSNHSHPSAPLGLQGASSLSTFTMGASPIAAGKVPDIKIRGGFVNPPMIIDDEELIT